MINGEDYAICYFWVSRKPIKQPKTQESTRTRISSWLEASEEALVMTVLFFQIFSPWRRVKFSTPLTLGLTMGLASPNTMWQKWHVPLLSRRDYEQMLCCPALFLLPWNQRNFRDLVIGQRTWQYGAEVQLTLDGCAVWAKTKPLLLPMLRF